MPGDQIAGRDELRHDLEPVRHERKRESRAAQEEHRHVNDLDEDVAFLRRIDDRGDDQTERPKRCDPEANKHEKRKQIRRIRHAENVVRQEQHQSDGGQIKNHAHGDRGEQQRHRRDRRDFVTPQNVFLALLHGAHARAEKSAAENANRRHHRDHDDGRASLFRFKGEAER